MSSECESFDFESDDNEDDAKATMKSVPLTYKAFNTEHLTEIRHKSVSEISEIFQCESTEARDMLQTYKWESETLVEDFLEDDARVLKKSGVVLKRKKCQEYLTTVPGFECGICGEDEEGLTAVEIGCEHPFCLECYTGYIKEKIESGISLITCPGFKCASSVPQELVAILTTDKTYSKYNDLLATDLVNICNRYKYCPAPDCSWAIENKPIGYDNEIQSVNCECGHSFCFECLEESHDPCPCDMTKKWSKKSIDDHLSDNWILTNTRCCPGCKAAIEKKYDQ